jgi:predicted DNA-binding protein (MmcQ/YjbR family)
MNIEEFRDYCLSLKGVEEKFPFGENVLVFYVGGKMFCLTDIASFDMINVKCDPDKAVILREKYPDVIPGYHMNKKHWNSIAMTGTIPNKLIKEWIRDSYELVIQGLPKKLRESLTSNTTKKKRA